MPQTYDFDPHYKGDTFRGKRFTIAVNGVPLDLTGATIRMHLRRKPLGPLVYAFSTEPAEAGIEQGHVTVIDGPAGIFELDAQIVDIPAASYVYDLEVTTASGFRETYLTGSWTIEQDITH